MTTERDTKALIYEAFARYVGDADKRAFDFPMFATGFYAALATSAASDRGGKALGWLFHNPDTGTEWSENHPVESGEVVDAENVRPATCEALHAELMAAWTLREETEAERAREASTTPAPTPVQSGDQLREALKTADWSGVPIGNKALIQAAIAALEATPPAEPAREGFVPIVTQEMISAYRDQSAMGRSIERGLQAVLALAPPQVSIGKRAIFRIIMSRFQFADLGHREENGDYTTTIGQSELLANLCSTAADAILAASAPPPPGGTGQGETFATIGKWCEETFGPITPQRMVERAGEEFDELRAEPDSAEEAADVLICLARVPGLWDAVERKMAKNRKRRWHLRGDGTGYHVKDAPPTTATRASEGRV